MQTSGQGRTPGRFARRRLAQAISVVRVRPLALLAPLVALPALAFGQSNTAASVPSEAQRSLSTIVVTATRIPEPAFNIPASINAVRVNAPNANTPSINPSEYLNTIPGVLARDRQDYAEGEQISIRGFGALATFGVVGVRVYTDGIPSTMPDGQGDVSNFDFGGADRIEVLRGPFSALYGNSSGGVIQIFTADGSRPPDVRVGFGGGSYGAWKADVGARGYYGNMGYNLDLSDFTANGYRQHSRVERINGNAKLDFKVGSKGKLTLLFNSVSLPQTQDPQGLTFAQLKANRRQAAPTALLFNTRKSVHQNQGGAAYTQQLTDHQQVHAMVYYGERAVQQFLSVPVAAQKNPLNNGGVIDLHSKYIGTDLRWEYTGSLAGRPFDLTAGVAWDRQNEHRQGFENFVGDTLGVVGDLRRNEQDDLYNVDEYFQGSWRFAEQWSLTLGARHSKVKLNSNDHYITDQNPDDSGRINFSSTDPVAGLMFRATDRWHLYASFGKGFQTPTTDQLSYRPDNEAGLNFALQPARSRNYEIGSKWRFGEGGTLDADLFEADTRDELAVLSSVGGRTTYHNVGRARRRGGEVSVHVPFAHDWAFDAAYTYLDAKFRDAFSVCSTGPSCAIPAGTRMPGVPKQMLYAALNWGGTVGWNAGLTVNAATRVSANDANTQVASGYVVTGVNAGYVLDTPRAEVIPFARIDNILGRHYVESVIVNQASGGVYQPAPGRTYWVGLRVVLRHRDG